MRLVGGRHSHPIYKLETRQVTHPEPFCELCDCCVSSGGSKICSRSSLDSSRSANWSTFTFDAIPLCLSVFQFVFGVSVACRSRAPLSLTHSSGVFFSFLFGFSLNVLSRAPLSTKNYITTTPHTMGYAHADRSRNCFSAWWNFDVRNEFFADNFNFLFYFCESKCVISSKIKTKPNSSGSWNGKNAKNGLVWCFQGQEGV